MQKFDMLKKTMSFLVFPRWLKHLNNQGIPCGVYYPIPLHKQKAYVDERYNENNFKTTNQLIKEVISLPMHTELDDEQIEFITQTVIEFITK